MFQLSVVEHIRLSFSDVVCSYTAHTTAASRLAHRAWQMKMMVLGLLGLGVASSVAAVMVNTRELQIAAAVLISLAFAAFATYLVLDFDPRVLAHRTCAARFWLLCEKYRALLTEIHDGLLDTAAITVRRDALIRDAHGVYEQAPPADRDAYRLAGSAVTTEAALSDAEVDRFLPESLRRQKPTAA
jgi:conflict system pore-forming effector with SLATT domain